MQVQNLNSEEDIVYNKLTAISQDIISHIKSNRQYRMKGKLTDAYTFIYNQCISKPSKSENMFNKYKQILSLHLVKSANLEIGTNIFSQTNKLWNGFLKFATILAKHVFAYLDRYFLPSRQNGNLIDIAASLFDKHLFGNPMKKKIYLQNFIKNIAIFRKNMIITNNHLYQFTRQLYAINTQFYFEFKKVYFESTRLFYNTKYNEIKHLQPIHFYNRVMNLIYFEGAIHTLCLFWTEEQLQKQHNIMPALFAKEIIEPYTDTLLTHEKGILWALKEFKIPLLNIVISAHSKFQGLQKIKKFYYDYVVQESKTLVQALETIKDQAKIIYYIAQFFNKHQTILAVGFKKHNQIHVTLSNALEFCVGKWEKVSQILFKYCAKTVTDKTFDENSAKIKTVFEKISSKDQFIHKCQTWVQSTILSDKAQLNEEYKFVNFIHELCGSQNTLKLNKLLSDYVEENKENNKTSNFVCKIISYHLWQRRFKEQIAICLTLPRCLQQIWTNELQRYAQTHSKKKIRILPLSSRLVLDLTFNQKNKLTVKCNLLQASIILSLQEQPKTEQQLIMHINTQKHLITSFVSSVKFITCLGEKLMIDWNSLEQGFKDFTQQFEEKSKFIKAIEQDRNILLQAGVVRMIKRRKEASFQEVYNYLCQTIKVFRPQPHMVKATIQKLIKRDFIEANEQGILLYKQ